MHFYFLSGQCANICLAISLLLHGAWQVISDILNNSHPHSNSISCWTFWAEEIKVYGMNWVFDFLSNKPLFPSHPPNLPLYTLFLILLLLLFVLSHIWLFVTQQTVSSLSFSVHVIFQARVLEYVAISFSRRSSQPRDGTPVSCTGRWILITTTPPRKPLF